MTVTHAECLVALVDQQSDAVTFSPDVTLYQENSSRDLSSIDSHTGLFNKAKLTSAQSRTDTGSSSIFIESTKVSALH